jgi:hypothetical protein
LPITLRAKCIGSLAREVLSTENSVVAGQVVNVFPNSFYLKTSGGDIAFFTNYSVRSPITINLDTTLNLEGAVKPLEPVYTGGKEIRVGTGCIIDLGQASVYQNLSSVLREPVSGIEKIGESLRVVSFILKIIETSQSALDPQGLAHARMVGFVSDAVISLRQNVAEERFLEAASKIVGLGLGFTPSGDDVLGGFLLAYNSFAELIGRAPILLQLRLLVEKTSWISAKLLDYMQHLIVDEQLNHALGSVFNGDEDDAVIALETLLPRGHTSGIDITVGAVLALSLIRDIALNKQETEIIARTLGLSRESTC